MTDAGRDGAGADAGGLRLRLWGVRGSLPVSGPQVRRFGGHTMCIEMRCGPHTLFFDAGSGIAPAGLALRDRGADRAWLYFTHWHYDHVMGLPFFKPLYDPGFTLHVGAGHDPAGTWSMLAGLMRQPFFPVCTDAFRARLDIADFRAGAVLTPFPGLTLRTGALNHPGGATGYRAEWQGRSVALITDTEHVPGDDDDAVLALAAGADLMLYDASYTPEEFDSRRGWGHSTWAEALRIGRLAGARRIGLIHHDVLRDDTALTAIDRTIRARHRGAFCAREGQVITLPPPRPGAASG